MEETRLPSGMSITDFVSVPAAHTFMMDNRVIDRTAWRCIEYNDGTLDKDKRRMIMDAGVCEEGRVMVYDE